MADLLQQVSLENGLKAIFKNVVDIFKNACFFLHQSKYLQTGESVNLRKKTSTFIFDQCLKASGITTLKKNQCQLQRKLGNRK